MPTDRRGTGGSAPARPASTRYCPTATTVSILRAVTPPN